MVVLLLVTLASVGASLKNLQADDVEELNEVEGLVALPPLFGYSATRASTLFPPFVYPRCEYRILPNEDHLHVDFKTNTVVLECQNPDKPAKLKIFIYKQKI